MKKKAIHWSRNLTLKVLSKKSQLSLVIALLLNCAPALAATLVHSYTFNDGTFKDAIGSANGTLNGSATISGGALQLPGGRNGTAYGSLPTSVTSGLTSVTFEGWFTQGPASNWAKLFFPGNINTSSFAGLTTTSGSSGPSRFDFLANGSSQLVANGPMLTNGTKYYFSAVLNNTGNTLSLYIAPVGGALGAPSSSSMGGYNLSNVTVNEFFVGRSPFGGDSDFSGSLDEFRIYNGPLSATQIAANFAAGPSVSPAPTALLTVNPASISSGSSATLSWSSSNATACVGTGFSTSSAVSGSISVSPASTTTYSISCSGAAGTVSRSATLTVTPLAFIVTPSGSNVSINPNSAQSVMAGAKQAFNITANAGYSLSSAVGGTCPAGTWSGSIYTTGSIVADCAVSFSASAIVYTVTPLGSNVAINPGFIQSVFVGAKQAFTVTANAGYSLSSAVGGSCPAGSWSGSVYTTGAITANCSVSFSASPILYTVTPSGANVVISPSSPQSVASGAKPAFTVNANAGFTLSSAVGGTCPAGSWSGSVYTTGAITANCSVSFSASPILYTVTPSGSNVVFSPNSPQTVSSGAKQAFTVSANAGFTLSSAVGGTCPTGSWSGSIYTTGAITANCSVSFSASAALPGVTAVPVNDFLNSMGISPGGFPLDITEQMLQYLGIRNIRTGLNNDGDANYAIELHNTTGVRAEVLNNFDMPTLLTEARKLASAGALLSIEGLNEPNNFPITYLGQTGGGSGTWLPVAKYQRDLYAQVKADPVLKNYPVIGVSETGAEVDNVGLQYLKIPASAGTLMPDGTQFADYANPHNYVCGVFADYRDNAAWNAADPILNAGWDGLFGDYGITWGHKFPGYANSALQALPRVTSETGWQTGVPGPGKGFLTEDQQGKMLLNVYLSQFKRGFARTFIFQMVDLGNPEWSTWGVFHGVGVTPSPNSTKFVSSNPGYYASTKPAADFIRNFTTILADTVSNAPGSLSYSIPSQPATVHDLLLQKSNGAFILAVWDERLATTDIDTVTINLGTAYSATVYDPTVGTAAVQVLGTTQSIVLKLSDHPVFVQLQ